MAKKSHIRKSLYNSRVELEHLNSNEMLLSELDSSKERIRETLEAFSKIPDSELFLKIDYASLGLEKEPDLPVLEWQPSCPTKFELAFRELVISPSTIYRVQQSWAVSKERQKAIGGPHERITAINGELRQLRQELKKEFSVQLLNEIRTLVTELHSIISFYFTRQKRYVKNIRINYCGAVIQDIRNKYRQIIRNIFKNLPDFSGCEEEAEFTPIAKCKPIFLIHNQFQNVPKRIFN